MVRFQWQSDDQEKRCASAQKDARISDEKRKNSPFQSISPSGPITSWKGKSTKPGKNYAMTSNTALEKQFRKGAATCCSYWASATTWPGNAPAA